MIDNIPETLDEAVDTIMAQMSEQDRAWFRDTPDAAASIHHGPGTALRNGWGLWDKESPLAVWFRARGLWHADDFSGTIFDAVSARLRGEPFDLAAEVAHYTAFWRESGCGFDGERIPGHVPARSYRLVKGADGKWRRQSDQS
jgi:hypothetical protein